MTCSHEQMPSTFYLLVMELQSTRSHLSVKYQNLFEKYGFKFLNIQYNTFVNALFEIDENMYTSIVSFKICCGDVNNMSKYLWTFYLYRKEGGF